MAWQDAVQPPQVSTFELEDDGTFPNSRLPLLVYSSALSSSAQDRAAAFESLFAANGWGGSWRNGIYTFRFLRALCSCSKCAPDPEAQRKQSFPR